MAPSRIPKAKTLNQKEKPLNSSTSGFQACPSISREKEDYQRAQKTEERLQSHKNQQCLQFHTSPPASKQSSAVSASHPHRIRASKDATQSHITRPSGERSVKLQEINRDQISKSGENEHTFCPTSGSDEHPESPGKLLRDGKFFKKISA